METKYLDFLEGRMGKDVVDRTWWALTCSDICLCWYLDYLLEIIQKGLIYDP